MALTLQFYSSKAYNFARKTFDLALPQPRCIISLYSKINGHPGFTEGPFLALRARVGQNQQKGSTTVRALMLDEMSRRKYVEYVGNKYCGFVDVGNDQCNDSVPVAKDAFVLMVVSLNNA